MTGVQTCALPIFIRERILTGAHTYAVLSFGCLLGMGDKLFAVPWRALTFDTTNKRFALNVPKDRLKDAPGFDKNNWPSMADKTWATGVHSFYGTSYEANELSVNYLYKFHQTR